MTKWNWRFLHPRAHAHIVARPFAPTITSTFISGHIRVSANKSLLQVMDFKLQPKVLCVLNVHLSLCTTITYEPSILNSSFLINFVISWWLIKPKCFWPSPGEKPYKCEYCDYAAAQKTSLRYHLDRRHRDKPYTEIPNIPVSSYTFMPSAKEMEPSPNMTQKCLSPSVPSTVDTKPDACDGLCQQGTVASGSPLSQVKTEPEDRVSEGTTALKPTAKDEQNLKAEGSEECETPLDLSLRVSVSVASASDLCQPPTNSCSSCPFTSLYPEVLLMHQKLVHKEKLEQIKRQAGRATSAALKLRRHTGCPPALEGRDVSPLITADRKHPRTQ